MKNSRYYPFERNRYFYGKLLTVRDFESEQKYLNDKRRLLNRLLHGGGVIAGMQVVGVDDKTISVEMGAAIDYQGREIVIPSPVTMKLSMVEGFTNNEYAKNVYLYVAYDEKGKEPVHSIANSAVRNEEVSEYNRVLESYKLFIREDAPHPTSFEHTQLTETIAMIFEDQHVRIYQKTPKYVNPEDVFEVELVIEKTLQTPQIRLEYDIDSDLFAPAGSDATSHISFTEPTDGQNTDYSMRYYVKAANKPDTKGKLHIIRSSVKLTLGDKKMTIVTNPENELTIIAAPVPEQIVKDYYNRTLDESLESRTDQSICLARISLLQVGPTYIIEKVENVPFGEYIYNASMLQKSGMRDKHESGGPLFVKSSTRQLPVDAEPQFTVAYDPEQSELDFKLGLPASKLIHDDMTTGSITVKLEKNQKSTFSFFLRGEKSYVTEEIDHGMGAGNVYIMVGLEEAESDYSSDMLDTSERIYYGSADVFKDGPFETVLPTLTFGTLVYPKKGTFRIGMKLQRATEASSITLRWWAFRKQGEGAGVIRDSLDMELAALEAAATKEDK